MRIKASEGHPSTVVTKNIKPTQGRSSKQANKDKSITKKRKRKPILG
jgi:hypothetical protein